MENNCKKNISIRYLLIFLVCFLSLPLRAEKIQIGGITYSYQKGSGEASVSKGERSLSSHVSILPSFICDGYSYKVTSIGKDAFLFCDGLTSITIPDGVTEIGLRAFSCCSGLTSITIPEGVTSIGSFAIEGCSGLTSINIPNSVTSIGMGAFKNCSGLTSINIPDGVTSIETQTFKLCSGLTSITIPEGVTSIGYEAFNNCSGLTSINIPDGVTSIAESAFNGCSGLTSINIPNGITSIGDYAFGGCSNLRSLTIPDRFIDSDIQKCSKLESLTVYGDVISSNCSQLIKNNPSLASVTIEHATSIGNSAFSGCSGLTSINIPDGVTSIGYRAFLGCSGLTSINIPDGVTSIGYRAFSGCSGLTSINIPDGVTSIGEGAIEGCSGLTSINIPDGVTSIESETFRGCSGLTSINIPDGVTSIESGTFRGCSGLTSINIPDGVTSIESGTFRGCSGLTSINIPDGVTSIGSWAFSGCSGLTSITIPDGVTSIGNFAFENCSGLTSLTIPNSVTSISSGALYGCSDLRSLTIPCRFIIDSYNHSIIQECSKLESLTVYGDEISSNCSRLIKNNPSLASVTIEHATSIGNSAFSGCSGLTSINIPDGVTSIGSWAFYGCSSLTSINIPNSVTSIGSQAFLGCSGLTSINIPDGVTSIESETFRGCSGLTSINIPDGVTEIGSDAFSGCSGLTSINIPNSVTSIGSQAFLGCCSGLTSLTVPIRFIDYGIIQGFSKLESLTVYGDAISRSFSQFIRNSHSLASVTIEHATSIGNSVFEGCSGLTSINIPNSVTSIGWAAFKDCSGLTSINIPDGVTSIKRGTFGGCSGLTSINIPTSVTSIGEAAFKDCSGLTSINIPTSVTSIGEAAFKDCSGLTSINIPDGVTSIESETFENCSGLTSINIPTSVTSIKWGTFSGCSGLTSINIPDGVTSIKWGTFSGCSGLTSINIPDGVTEIGSNAFYGCSGLTSINLPTSVTSIGKAAFKDCSGLSRAMAIPSNVTKIADETFMGCSSLPSVRLTSNVISIGNQAFDGCKAFKSFSFTPNITSIGNSAFRNCGGLTSIKLPSKVAQLGDYAFADCENLESAIFNSNVKINFTTFENDAKLKTLTSDAYYFDGVALYDKEKTNLISVIDYTISEYTGIPETVTAIGELAFKDCSNLSKINLPSGLTFVGTEAFYGCSKLEEINIPNVKFLGYNTFKGCSALKKANILACESIADSVFKDCAALQSIQIKTELLGHIGKAAFAGCSSLTSPWEFLNSDMTIDKGAFIGCTSLKKIRVRRNKPFSDQFAENMVVYVPEGSKETYQNALPQCTIYEDYSKNGQKYQDLLSLYDSYNQIDFKPLVDEGTESNVLTDVSQLSANYVNEYEGSLDALVDDSDDSYFLSAWDADNPNEDYHYIQADLKKGCKAFNITFKRRSTNDNSAPTRVHVFVTNTLDDDNSWIDLGTYGLEYNNLTASINANCYAKKVRYVKLQVEATVDNTKENGNLFFALNKLDISPCCPSIPKWDDGLYYAIENTFGEYAKEFLEGTKSAEAVNNGTFFGLQYATPIKYFVMKYLKSDDVPTQTMQLNSSHEDGSSENLTFDADYSYFGNSTGIYCAQFENPLKGISLQSIDNYSEKDRYYLRSAHVYTRPPKANLMQEDARKAIKDMLSLYEDKDFIRENDFETLQNYCNEVDRLAQSGRFADFAKHEYRTFYADYPAVVPMLVKAGIVKEQNGELVVDYIYNEGDVIPANTGVILKGNCLGNAYVMEQGTTDATSPEGNLLHGTVDDEETYVDGCSRYYMLSYDKAGDSRLGFYWNGENGPHPFINQAYKAYLAIPDTYSAMDKESFSLAEMEEHRGETTHISSVSDDKNHMQSGIYGIDGRKIDATNIKQLPAGVYIVNGRKVIVK